MSNVLKLPYPPSANRMWRSFNGHVVKAPGAQQYQRTVQILAAQAGVIPTDDPVWLDITLHPKKPKKDTGVQVRSIDLSNCIKCAEDALNGIAWVDDRQVEKLTARRGEPVEGGALIVRWEIAE
jgi:crossover junction endodeoxyribonuclease RusA